MADKAWDDVVPEICDVCGQRIKTAFIDGKTVAGPWSIMCVTCHKYFGCGLGNVKGQKYELQINGEWMKVEG